MSNDSSASIIAEVEARTTANDPSQPPLAVALGNPNQRVLSGRSIRLNIDNLATPN
jgi:hypothetical protein